MLIGDHVYASCSRPTKLSNRITAIETNMLTLGITEHSSTVDTENDQVHDALAMTKAFREQSQPFANLSLYEHRHEPTP